MKPESVVIYERVLCGERWPTHYVGTPTSKDRAVEILRYLLFEKMGVKDFDEAKALFTKEFVKAYRLGLVIRPFYKPPELLPDEYDHILWLLFPERKKGKKALIVKVYSEVLSGRRKNFPRGYFTDAVDGRFRAEVCVKHLCQRILHLSGDKIAREFCHSNGIKTLAKYKLKILLNHVYFSLSEMMYEVYPQLVPKMQYYQRIQDKRYKDNKKRGESNGNIQCVRNPSGKTGGDGGETE